MGSYLCLVNWGSNGQGHCTRQEKEYPGSEHFEKMFSCFKMILRRVRLLSGGKGEVNGSL